LSERLKTLETNQLIEKGIESTTPVKIAYHLSPKGQGLNRIIYELMKFGLAFCVENSKIFDSTEDINLRKILRITAELLV
jgi:DNA-binding HxlR family transcriptional regulator